VDTHYSEQKKKKIKTVSAKAPTACIWLTLPPSSEDGRLLPHYSRTSQLLHTIVRVLPTYEATRVTSQVVTLSSRRQGFIYRYITVAALGLFSYLYSPS